MKTTSSKIIEKPTLGAACTFAAGPKLAYASPYDRMPERKPKNPVVRAGMSVAETVIWLVIMAALSIGMIVLLWNVSR